MGLCLTGDVSVWYVSRSPCPSILANGTHTLTDGTSRHHNVHKNAFRCFTKTLVDAKVSVFFFPPDRAYESSDSERSLPRKRIHSALSRCRVHAPARELMRV